MDMTIEYLPAYRLAYKRQRGPYGSENLKVMEELKNWAKAHELFEEGIIFGIPQDNPKETPPEACRYDSAIVVDEALVLDDSVKEGTFAEGQYAVFQVSHTAEGVAEAWQRVFERIADEGLRLRQAPIVERYRSELVKQHLSEICLPIVGE